MVPSQEWNPADVPPDRRLWVACQMDAGGPIPARFGLGGALHDVEGVLDRWVGADHRYFRVRTRDGATWILRHDERLDAWEVTTFEAGAESRAEVPPRGERRRREAGDAASGPGSDQRGGGGSSRRGARRTPSGPRGT
jgi:hypothetical protein